MRISSGQAVLVIAVIAVCTALTRAVPFLLFGGKKEVPDFVQYLGKILPSAIMATLIVFCLKGVSFVSGSHGLPELLAIGAVAALHLWKRNTLLSIGVGTVIYMVLVQAVF